MKAFLNALVRISASSLVGVGIYRIGACLHQSVLRFGSTAKQRALFPDARSLSLDLRAEVKYPDNVRFGSNVIVGARCQLGAMARIVIGDDVRISRGVLIETATLDLESALPYRHTAMPISIGDGVWLGANSTVLGGVTIGTGAVIGAGTVVSRDVEAWSIVVAAPSRILTRKIIRKEAQ